MHIQKRDINRNNWAGVLRHTDVRMLQDGPDFRGLAALMHMLEVEKPLIFDYDGQKVRAVDSGFYWLQMIPERENWWLTVMFDTERRPVQAYFDITGENHILPDGQAWFTDLFLDVVVMPDGRLKLLDADELEQALQTGVITLRQYEDASRQAQILLERLAGRTDAFFSWAAGYFRRLLPAMGQNGAEAPGQSPVQRRADFQ